MEPDRLEVRHGPGPAARWILFIALGAIGSCFAIAPLFRFADGGPAGKGASIVIIGLGIFTLWRAPRALRKNQVVLDRGRRIVLAWPDTWRPRSSPLDPDGSLVLKRTPGTFPDYDPVFVVSLGRLTIDWDQDLTSMRVRAGSYARFLDIPLRDEAR